MACGSWAAAKFNLWQRQTCDIFQQSGEAAIDGAVAAGETYAAQGTLDDGESRGGGMALKLSKAQKRHARRGRMKILAKTIEER